MKIPILLAAALLAFAAPAGAGSAQLTIGHGWAWVRETFPPSGELDIERIVWTNPPPEIDLDSLQVWSVRRPWPIRDWRWSPGPARPASAAPDDQPVIWRPAPPEPPPPARNELDIRLDMPLSHRMGHSLTYRLPGFDWHTFYRVTVRGIGPESIGAVQVDLSAYLRIRNDTTAAFPDARVSLVGTDPFLLPPPKPFGLLELNPDTPLSDVWLSLRDPVPLLPHHYPLQTHADIPAKGVAEIRFARVDRKPAQILHIGDSDDIPAPTQRGGLPLRRVLLVPNTPAMGLGFALPPGEADLYLGAARGAPVQSGHVYHTPHPGTLQIAMGPAETVRATRHAGEETALPEGGLQADHSIILVNRLDSPVQVRVVERPATPLQWSLVRSSVPATVTTRTLQFDLTVPPKSSHTISYRLRMVSRSM